MVLVMQLEQENMRWLLRGRVIWSVFSVGDEKGW